MADHMLVDPAFKLEKMKEAHEKLYAMHIAFREIDRQAAQLSSEVSTPFDKGIYENWWAVEKSIRKFDRWHNKIEKWESRHFLDSDNHDRMSLNSENTETIEDVIDSKIFKYKYRVANDSPNTYMRRMDRVAQRSLARAETRDPIIEQDMTELMQKHDRESGVGQFIYSLTTGNTHNNELKEKTKAVREYILEESEQQYRDYYESDDEEDSFFEYMDNMTRRDKIRMMEIFEDFTLNKKERKGYTMLPRRENNPELSIF